MGVMPMGGEAAPPAEAGAASATFKVIYSPLDTLGKILADLDFKTYLENNFGDSPEELAKKVWVMYGGSEDGLSEGKKGARPNRPASDDMMEQNDIQEDEYNATRDKRWLRLPIGVSIDEITDLETLTKAMTGGFQALIKQNAKPAQASNLNKIIRIANEADKIGQYRYADQILSNFLNVHTSN